jgi:hypothetical protein
MRTSPVSGRSWGSRCRRVLAAAATFVVAGTVVAPLPRTQAAASGHREPVGHAGSQVAEAGPVAAGLSLAASFGTATADLAGRAARAEAAAVQPGLLGLLVPEPLAGQLPPPTRAESGGAAQAERSLAAPPPAGPAALAGARERAAATADGASAVADLGPVTVAGTLTVSGGTSEVEVAAGASRAVSRIGELRLGSAGAGLVVLRGLRWTAFHADGQPGRPGFEIASAEIAGRPVAVASPGQVASAIAAAAAVLAPQGITVAVPAATGDGTGAAVGPLRIELRDPPALRTAGAAVYAPLAPVASDASKRLHEASGPAGSHVDSALLVGNIVLSTLLGNGGVTIGLGGASAGATTREVPDLDFFRGVQPPVRNAPPARPGSPGPTVPASLPVAGLASSDATPPAFAPLAGPTTGLRDIAAGPGVGAPIAGAPARPDGGAQARGALRRHAGPVTGALAGGLAVASVAVRRSRRRLLASAAALRGVERPARGRVRPAHGFVGLITAAAVLAAAAAPSRSPSTLSAGVAQAPGAPSSVPGAAGADGSAADAAVGPDAGGSAAPDPSTPRSAGRGAPSGGRLLVAGRTATTAGSGAPTSATSGAAQPGAATAPATVTRAADCPGGDRQDRNSAYSPPCLHFSGDNGGATSKGVTGDRIVIAMRKIDDMGGRGRQYGITDTAADFERTLAAYVDYFNRVYELHGRQVEIVFYKPKSGGSDAFRGGDQEEANADALVVGQQIKAFADVSATYPALADALARQRVVAIGPVHMPQDWYEARAPYTWGLLPDCTSLLANNVDYLVKRLAPYPARFAGDPGLRSKPRALGVVVPDSPFYQQCANQAEARLAAAGHRLAARVNYPLDFNQAAQTATNVVSQLKAAGVTTVVCWCDPVLPYFATTQATQQEYGPEWVISGFALTDSDLAGQLYDRQQWSHAFGLSLLGELTQGYDSESYRAYKALRADEPAALRDILYYPLVQLFSCLQMAGPNLTPQTFEQGCFTAPWGAGEMGRWRFGPGDHTAMEDAREVYWDPDGKSSFNGKPGRYAATLDGRRFRGDWPAGEPPFPPPR